MLLNEKVLKDYIKFIKHYIKDRPNHDFVAEDFNYICGGINQVLLIWTGNTYVGRKKDPETEKQFQRFFTLIHDLILFCTDNKEWLSEQETSFADMLTYHGAVYRYLGLADYRNYRRKEIVEPEYNNIYVSWSKSESNSYIVGKLYGPITWMKATIKEPDFGLDIHGFEEWCKKWYGGSNFITRGEEKEVVFPTLEKYIEEIKYFNKR